MEWQQKVFIVLASVWPNGKQLIIQYMVPEEGGGTSSLWAFQAVLSVKNIENASNITRWMKWIIECLHLFLIVDSLKYHTTLLL